MSARRASSPTAGSSGSPKPDPAWPPASWAILPFPSRSYGGVRSKVVSALASCDRDLIVLGQRFDADGELGRVWHGERWSVRLQFACSQDWALVTDVRHAIPFPADLSADSEWTEACLTRIRDGRPGRRILAVLSATATGPGGPGWKDSFLSTDGCVRALPRSPALSSLSWLSVSPFLFLTPLSPPLPDPAQLASRVAVGQLRRGLGARAAWGSAAARPRAAPAHAGSWRRPRFPR